MRCRWCICYIGIFLKMEYVCGDTDVKALTVPMRRANSALNLFFQAEHFSQQFPPINVDVNSKAK